MSDEQELTNLICEHATIDEPYPQFPHYCISVRRKAAKLILVGIGFYKLQAQLKEAEEVIAFYGNKYSWSGSTSSQTIRLDGDNYESRSYLTGGKKAREYQSKYKSEK